MTEIEDDLPEQIRIRHEKRARMLQAGIDVYPIEVPRSISLEDLRSKFGQLEIDVATGEIESVKIGRAHV